MDKSRVLRFGAGRPRRLPDSAGADRAYSNSLIRKYLRRRGVRHVISEKSDSRTARWRRGSDGGAPPGFDKSRYKARNTVERAINKIKQFQAVATRYDKRRYIYLGTVTVAASSSGSVHDQVPLLRKVVARPSDLVDQMADLLIRRTNTCLPVSCGFTADAGQHCRHRPGDTGTTRWADQGCRRYTAEASRTPRLSRSPQAHRADRGSFRRGVEQEGAATRTCSQYDLRP